MKPFGICQNKKVFDHSTAWTQTFINYCDKNGIPYEVFDPYTSDVVQNLGKYSALLWHFSNYVVSDMLEARSIMHVAESKGLVVFPSIHERWHFDDKIAEMYALQAVNAPIPDSWVFYVKEDCQKWLRCKAEYPLVAKLRCGSGSNNVKLLRNSSEAIAYCNRMFSKGYDPSPSLLYKAQSKLKSSKSIQMAFDRIKKIPEFLNTRRHGKMMPREKGYCYYQKFVPNEGYDLKVVVIGDKMTFCARNVRKNDFRASGGGDLYYDRELLTDNVIDSAFSVAEHLRMDCVGFDYVVDRRSGQGMIIEMCYGFDYSAQELLGAYVDKNHVWHNEPVVVPGEIIKKTLERVKNKHKYGDTVG